MSYYDVDSILTDAQVRMYGTWYYASSLTVDPETALHV